MGASHFSSLSSLQVLCLIHIIMAPFGVSKPAKEVLHKPVKVEELDPMAIKISDKSGLAEKAGKSSTEGSLAVNPDDFDDEYLTASMLEFGDIDTDGLLDYDELFRFYLAIIKFPVKKASETARSFIDLGDKNKDRKLSLKELLSIMDEAKHLAEARKRMKMEKAVDKKIEEPSPGQAKTVEDKNPSQSMIPKRGDNHAMEGKGTAATGTSKQEERKYHHSVEQNVEELHNLQAEKK